MPAKPSGLSAEARRAANARYYRKRKAQILIRRRIQRGTQRPWKGIPKEERVPPKPRFPPVEEMTLEQLIATQDKELPHGGHNSPVAFHDDWGDGVSIYDDPTAEAALDDWG